MYKVTELRITCDFKKCEASAIVLLDGDLPHGWVAWEMLNDTGKVQTVHLCGVDVISSTLRLNGQNK